MGRVASGLAQPPILGGFLFGKGSRSGQGRVLVFGGAQRSRLVSRQAHALQTVPLQNMTKPLLKSYIVLGI